MIGDAQIKLSAAQSVAATADSTNHYNMSAARNIAAGLVKPKLMIQVTTAIAGASGIVDIEIEFDDNSSFSSGKKILLGSFSVADSWGTTVGDRFEIILSPNAKYPFERYFQLVYTDNGSNVSAGAVDAWVVLDVPEHTLYPANYTVS